MFVNTGKYRPNKSEPTKKRYFGGDNIPRENTAEGRLNQANENIRIDSLYGFQRVTDVKERTGYLLNMHTTEIVEEDKRLMSGVDYYFLEEDCTRFKVSMPFYTYFYILCRKKTEQEVSTFLLKKYNGVVVKVEIVTKEDLDLPNHLIGLKQKYLKLSFANSVDMIKVKRDINRAVYASKEREKANTYYTNLLSDMLNPHKRQEVKKSADHMENILDIREHDVPHHVRVSIDCEIFVGLWYTIKTRGTDPPIITRRKDLIEPIDPIVLAYDIETTKLPMKFPDSATDQIMMISYMIDGQGYLITNREIISSDIEDFEYTPRPEFEGLFTVFNEANEKATLMKFFDHINDVRPHIFVSYYGDGFDWPFVEARAAFHEIDMKSRIGFSKVRDEFYGSRPAIHLDCLHWVKRDSYLPVGSQGLKAVAKAKLRYDPVELDAEDMCKLAVEEPETLANYSVSDAVATYYLYQKYVQPFIFALCTIIPMNPDEVLRKGSGTLCESLLMVEAFKANIIFPNKQTSELNKLTEDGHVLDVETYVGGHVEALESGIFRADIPCRFNIEPSVVDDLMAGVEKSLRHTIQEEEQVPLEMVLNFEEVANEIRSKLAALKEHPVRQENPVIYHLDVAAMYPNIILTNRLQPSAIVNEVVCGACDFNRPGAACKREMEWAWRGEYLPATLGEFQRIKQQLETETIKSADGSAARPFHELPLVEQAALEKKRLSDYCRKAYAKTKVTKIETRKQTICQKENSFYVDTVRAFRDRRYEYKGLTKLAKQQVADAVASGDASEIKSAKNREIVYDSLQLAHKCILNSFYGYVMRKGSRWFSMEMGGIVCQTGGNIIKKAREIIEKVGRPLELDTDGIWCILPRSFPDNFIVNTTHPKKTKLVISYPNAVLNFMVKDKFTNDVYHELVDPVNAVYEIRSENSIFFEVDGPYRAMVLPAAKEEGKKLKKRYAVFNFDGSLAELKGFEVKRRGELQLIKIFQSSVFESFLKGETLEECYKSVAKVADYWLDVLYSKGADMPDDDLFELISEKKSMSRKLEDYGTQKSTAISTARRLMEFLGSDMVKDKGLACRFVISRKPQGSPVTERAIPLKIFQAEESVKQHYLRKWLKDSGMQSFDIRDIIDWGYYIERLGSTIQKIITIPAAYQGLSNPVPRVKYPDWLHKKLFEKNDVRKQRRITDIFHIAPKPQNENESDEPRMNASDEPETNDESNESAEIVDIEDSVGRTASIFKRPVATVSKRKRQPSVELDEEILSKSWRDVLGTPPRYGETSQERQEWLEYHKKKWNHQAQQRKLRRDNKRSRKVVRKANKNTLDGFIERSQQILLKKPWQIIQIAETNEPGMFRLWVMVDRQLHQLRLRVPRIFYVNTREQRGEPGPNETWKKCSRILPRSRPVYNLYQYTVPEDVFAINGPLLTDELSKPEVEGIYETQMSLEFRAILNLGCVCVVDPSCRDTITDGSDTFSLEQLQFKSVAAQRYLEEEVKHVFLYHHWSSNHQRGLWGLFLGPSKRAYVYVLDSVRSNQMPNMRNLYVNERANELAKISTSGKIKAPEEMHFEVRAETSFQAICRSIQAALGSYKNEMKGATMLAVQTAMDFSELTREMPLLNEFPLINTRVQDPENLFNTLEWQRLGGATMIAHYIKSERVLNLMAEQCRYFHAPIGNIPTDPAIFGADLFYARNLSKHNFVLWYSTTDRPDLGGSENDDNRLLTDFEESTTFISNYSGTYSSVCVELDIDSLAVNTLLQSQHVNDIDGTSSFVSFNTAAQVSLQEMVTGDSTTAVIPSYDETALCDASFKVLRGMVSTWLKDVTIHKNVYADCQLMHFYRWLRSPSALLYDPALRRTLHNYMKKLFIQLVAEFMRLGSRIVFANFNKIIICTRKTTIKGALRHVKHVVSTIRDKELFHSINITYEGCWLYLMWLDLPNHAGVLGKLKPKDLQDNENEEEEREEEEEEEVVEEEDDDDTPEIVMNWNLKEILPKEALCRDHFSTIIAGYISAVYQHIVHNESETGTPRRKRRDSNISQTQTAPLGLGALENSAEFAKKLVAGELSQKLFQVVQKIHKRLPEKIVTIEENPNLDLGGAESKKISPALEFVKAVCKVLSLDKEMVDDVYDLKNNLLRLIGVGSFSDKAEWKDPCISFMLPEVICKTCNHTRDIDLCKDTSVNVVDGIYLWTCPMCESSYDNTEIEFALVDTLYRRTMGYVLQDLQCRKCLQIKRDNVNEYCTCSGDFRTTIERQEMIQCVKILKSISKKCRMLLLADAIGSTRLIDEPLANS